MNFRAERLNAGVTLSERALKMGVTRRTLQVLEKTGRMPSAPVAKRIADFYGVEVTELWPLDPEPTERAAA